MTPESKITLRDALRAVHPALVPSAALEARIAALAAEAAAHVPHQTAHRRQVRLRLLGAGATALLILALVLMPPRLTAVQAFQRMTDAVRAVRSAHYTEWNIQPDGSRVKTDEIWYQAGNWRVEHFEAHYRQVQVCRHGVRWMYDTSTERITRDNAAFPEGFEWGGVPVAPDLPKSGGRQAAIGHPTDVTLPGTARINGRPAHTIVLSAPITGDGWQGANRSVVTVDDATNLPVRSEEQTQLPGTTYWTTRYVREDDYNQVLSASIFRPDFPKTARLVDAAADRTRWYARLDKGIASREVGQTSFAIRYAPITLKAETRLVRRPAAVVVRDFQVNKDGDVFLLLTANSFAGYELPFGTAELTDEFGTKYLEPSSQKREGFVLVPTCVDPIKSGPKISGFVFNNEQVEGKWWVPLQKQTPWKPRRFQLTLHLHVGYEDRPSTLVFDLPVRRAEAEDLPGYMPYMARPLPMGCLPIDNAETRGYYYWHDAHDLPQALVSYQEAIALNVAHSRKLGQPPYNAYQWFDIFQILTEMGRKEEAKTALLHAKADDDRALYPPETRPWIRAEMQKLGLNP